MYGFDIAQREINSHYFDDEVQIENIDLGHKPSYEYGILNALVEKNIIEIKS